MTSLIFGVSSISIARISFATQRVNGSFPRAELLQSNIICLKHWPLLEYVKYDLMMDY